MSTKKNTVASSKEEPSETKDNDSHNPPSGHGSSGRPEEGTADKPEAENGGILIPDAACAPVNIRYPQDISLLNEARVKLEAMILWFHRSYHVALPRSDCRAAGKAYLSYAKAKKHSAKQTRKALKKQLSYVKRNIRYLESQEVSFGYFCSRKKLSVHRVGGDQWPPTSHTTVRTVRYTAVQST